MNAPATAVNPFGSSEVAARQAGAMISVEQQRVVAEVPTTNETHDVARVDDVPENNRWFNRFQRDVAVLERSQHDHSATSDRTDKSHATRYRCSNLGAGSRLDIDSAMTS